MIIDNTEPDEFYDVNRQERVVLRIINNVVANPDDEKMIVIQPSIALFIYLYYRIIAILIKYSTVKERYEFILLYI